MYLLRLPELAERMMRALNLRGSLPEQVSERFDASITVEDLTAAEFAYLRRTRRFAAFGEVPALAGEFSTVSLVDAAGGGAIFATNFLAVVEGVWLNNVNATAAVFNLFLAAGALVNEAVGSGGSNNLDSRLWTGGTKGTALLGAVNRQDIANPYAIANAIGRWSVPAGASLYVPLDLVLTSGFSLGVQPALQNTACSVTFVWRERTATESELR